MSSAVVILPRLLEPAVGQVRRVDVEGETLKEALDSLLASHPTLRVHLFDEKGDLRQHVVCFINGRQTRLEDRALDLTEGTEITFLQAVSGG